MGYLGFLAHQCAVFLLFWAFVDGFLNGLGTALFGTESTVLSARVNRSAASGPSIISGWGFMAPSWHRTAEWMFCLSSYRSVNYWNHEKPYTLQVHGQSLLHQAVSVHPVWSTFSG